MRTLVLMRHAAAEGFVPGGDMARPLSEEGRREAVQVGEQLKALGVQHALVSSAVRTRETFSLLGLDVPAEFMDALYEGGTETLLQRIGEIPDEVDCLLVVGHAPAIPSLSAELAYADSHGEADRMQCWFPTGTFTRFDVEGSWQELAEGGRAGFRGVHRIAD